MEQQHVVRIHLDAAHNVTAATVTTFVDETVTYTVDVDYGPFETPEEVLAALLGRLDQQMALW